MSNEEIPRFKKKKKTQESVELVLEGLSDFTVALQYLL
jgi:hypothetical protein